MCIRTVFLFICEIYIYVGWNIPCCFWFSTNEMMTMSVAYWIKDRRKPGPTRTGSAAQTRTTPHLTTCREALPCLTLTLLFLPASTNNSLPRSKHVCLLRGDLLSGCRLVTPGVDSGFQSLPWDTWTCVRGSTAQCGPGSAGGYGEQQLGPCSPRAERVHSRGGSTGMRHGHPELRRVHHLPRPL